MYMHPCNFIDVEGRGKEGGREVRKEVGREGGRERGREYQSTKALIGVPCPEAVIT